MGQDNSAQEPSTCYPTEFTCTALGSLPTGYSGLDTACTMMSVCADGAAVCAAGYNGVVSSRACTTDGTAFDAFTGCTGVGAGVDLHVSLCGNGQ